MKEAVLKTTRFHRDRKGFTLLEALVGLAIISFGLLAVVTLIDASFNASTLSKDTTKATHMAAWMMDRIKQDTSLVTQIYTTNITNLRSFDNDASLEIKIDTNVAADPAAEPARTAVQEWRALLKGLAIANGDYMDRNQLPGDRLPEPLGTVIITPYDPTCGGNHRVRVDVAWPVPPGVPPELLFPPPHRVTIVSVLASAE